MKIRISLRLYFFVSMVLLSSLMALGFSVLSGNYYIDGLDKGLKEIMLDLSQTVTVEDGRPMSSIGFSIASRWQDLPKVIQQRFDYPTEQGVLHKDKDSHSMFTMPTNLYFVAYFTSPKGEPRYISRVILDNNKPATQNSQHKERLIWVAITGLSGIVLFSFFLFVNMKIIAKPIESLRGWAKSLNPTNLQDPPPDFIYNELNSLATLIRASLVSAHDSLDREQKFLSYASHELRTPISVIRSNVELLNRLSEKTPMNDKQHNTLARIERAGLTMSDLTDTLLWLSRDESQLSAPEQLNLNEKITTLSNELDYLLNGKHVNVHLNTDNQSAIINTEAIACHIVLANLIRNAYQHTQRGDVEITQHGTRVSIVNSWTQEKEVHDSAYSNKVSTMGYGLGLQLSERIIKRHNWFYEINDKPGRYEVTVNFEKEI